MGQMWKVGRSYIHKIRTHRRVESLIGKLNALTGFHGGRFKEAAAAAAAASCGIPFTGADVLSQNILKLHNSGFPGMGREVLYSGVTGEPLDGPVYIGCVFYHPGIDFTTHTHTKTKKKRCLDTNVCDTWFPTRSTPAALVPSVPWSDNPPRDVPVREDCESGRCNAFVSTDVLPIV